MTLGIFIGEQLSRTGVKLPSISLDGLQIDEMMRDPSDPLMSEYAWKHSREFRELGYSHLDLVEENRYGDYIRNYIHKHSIIVKDYTQAREKKTKEELEKSFDYQMKHVWYQNWSNENSVEAIRRFQEHYKDVSRKDMYRYLLKNTGAPWTSINALINMVPIDPDSMDSQKEHYYNNWVPYWGYIVQFWWTYVDKSQFYADQLHTFELHLLQNPIKVSTIIIEETKKDIKEFVDENKLAFGASFAGITTVIGLVAGAYIVSKVV